MQPVARLDFQQLRADVDATLATFMQGQSDQLADIAAELTPFAAWLSGLMAGGKRLRPAFCVAGFFAGGGVDVGSAIPAASSLELLQAGALVHDDVMDRSDVRRGMPAAHRSFEALHRRSGWSGQPARFGEGAAILLGDLALCWADELYFRSDFPAEVLVRARPIFDVMRTEVMSGQILDLLAQAKGKAGVDEALRVVRFKSAKYTVERPLHLGARLAGAEDDLLAGLTRYGLPLGEAFQLRDDLLGVFGDPVRTGKPAGDDLREGKQTLLLAIARERADRAQARLLDDCVGSMHLDHEHVDLLRSVIEVTGARDEVESVIARRTSGALESLDALEIPVAARQALADLALAATERRH